MLLYLPAEKGSKHGVASSCSKNKCEYQALKLDKIKVRLLQCTFFNTLINTAALRVTAAIGCWRIQTVLPGNRGMNFQLWLAHVSAFLLIQRYNAEGLPFYGVARIFYGFQYLAFKIGPFHRQGYFSRFQLFNLNAFDGFNGFAYSCLAVHTLHIRHLNV